MATTAVDTAGQASLRPAVLNRHQRRTLGRTLSTTKRTTEALKKWGLADPGRLSALAFSKLVANLEGYGNVLSDRHRAALMRLVGGYSMLASRMISGRYAYPLDTGCGKTQSVVAWCAAVHERGLPYSVAIAASKVEALCDLKRDLIKNGIPEELIGLWHSYRYETDKADGARQGKHPGYASMPATADHARKQFLLVTHSRIRGAYGLDQLNTYRGQDRDLVIWDESLLVSDHRAIAKLDLQSELGWIGPQLQKGATQNPLSATREAAYEYLTRCMAILEVELAEQTTTGRPAQPVRLPECSAETIDAYSAALGPFGLQTLTDLLEVSHKPVRVVRSNQGGGAYVAYDIVVPEELKRIAVLDASWPIRTLEQLDKSIQKDPGFDGRVKTYSNVTINFLKHASGRETVEQSFRQAKAEDRLISQEVTAAVKTIPTDQGVILFTFKKKTAGRVPVDIEAVLRADLEAAGIDLLQTISTPQGEKPRVVVLKFGQETSLSEFSYCRNVVFAGVLHRSDCDLAGAIVGQRDDLLTEVSAKDIRSVKTSEIVHLLYQGMSRGSCRVIVNGEAMPMSVWLIHHDNAIKEPLQSVMPGVRWASWDAKHLSPSSSTIADLAVKIARFLDELPKEVTRVSVKEVKAGLSLDSISNRTFQLARDAALRTVPWVVVGRSLARAF